MEKLRFFEGPKMGAAAALAEEAGRQWNVGEEIGVDENGLLDISPEVNPQGFYLVLYIQAQSWMVITQRNLTRHHGDYRSPRFEHLANMLGDDWAMISFDLPIPVERQGEQIWTAWKGRPSWKKPMGMSGNKVDCWILDKEGHVDLFQVGVVTHDNGQTWHLLGEYRWRGKLFRSNGNIVGKPKKPVWGDFGIRVEILDYPDFKDYLRKIPLAVWKGTPKELNPCLDPVPEQGYARVQWYSPFTGQTGLGPVELSDGSSGWVHGIDILNPANGDGIRRLQRNDLVRYAGTATFGNSVRLLCVEKV